MLYSSSKGETIMYDKKSNNNSMGGNMGIVKHKKGGKSRSRTSATHQRKLSRLKSLYMRLFRNSQKTSEKYNQMSQEDKIIFDRKRRLKDKSIKSFFCLTYPNFDSFLSKYNLKRVIREEPKVSMARTTSTAGIWGAK